jgi:hypothetical protein
VYGVGLVASGVGTQVTAAEFAVDGTQAWPVADMVGHGITVQNGAKLTAARLRLVGTRAVSLVALNSATEVTVTTALVDWTLPTPDGLASFGIAAFDASLTLRGAVVARAVGAGVECAGASARLDARGLAVSDTLAPASKDGAGIGVYAMDGCIASGRIWTVVRSRFAGVEAINAGTRLEVERLAIADTLAPPLGDESGVGLAAVKGADVKVTDARIVGNLRAGVALLGPATLTLKRAWIDDTLPISVDLHDGIGINASGETGPVQLGLDDVVVRNSRGAGIALTGKGSHLDARGLVVAHTQAAGAGDLLPGLGIGVDFFGTATLRDVRLHDNRYAGLLAGHGAAVWAQRLAVDRTRADAGSQLGVGVAVGDGAKMTLQTARIHANRTMGILAQARAPSPHYSRLLPLQARLPRASRLSSSLLAAAHR